METNQQSMSNSSLSLCVNIEKWYANSPGLDNKEHWLEWANTGSHPESFDITASNIPAMMRRRMSSLSKLAVHAAIELLNQNDVDYMVFSSRHGELHRSIALVKDILLGEEASPMAFSQSVHNTAAGLTTIATKKPIPLTSIAAGKNTFQSALTEAYLFLSIHPDAKVLLVDFDEPLPQDYAEFETQTYRGYALAMLVSAGQQFAAEAHSAQQPPEHELPQALQFFRGFLQDSVTQWSITGSRQTWTWNKK
ncbi:beta-ketoacyl synthase chain length factor [Vibrio vulnificus]|uniref:beta-ketoacyl synthase chain length factor n=2 Tax=Vibrio vulnificus TaxID=672 RepID=UPI000C7E0C13|nr:beta-ketoacyl synthase chain length factor [Vibrio vulnificus]AUL95016.1 3-oxoacyl-ACP synthase [Vibrio vulnificus]EGQ8076003.1 beta-ketoacyl synthase chain length factor [Vibrio vulnificus]EHH0791814.1 beta-ketoacyl synthase chain length factor [Vibrio vulnificus]EHZ2900495.1 beta-ketoacyl synthase chain length factor [Vibrio vulnificus]EIA1335661.1 beta-ketoacyl synthase chain length factor [Vibrio vulnificus]